MMTAGVSRKGRGPTLGRLFALATFSSVVVVSAAVTVPADVTVSSIVMFSAASSLA